MSEPLIAAELAGRDALARHHRKNVGAVVREGHGQIMTPSDVAAFMAVRLQPRPGNSLLEPGAGLGILAHAAITVGHLAAGNMTLVELEATCQQHLRNDPTFRTAELIEGEFIGFGLRSLKGNRRWDRIIANPPYLNFHDFDRVLVDQVAAGTGVKMTKFSNLFSLFILVGARLLAPGGRMVFITPTELFTTNYGKRTLQHLPPDVRLTNVVVFEPDAEPFEDALTTACITTFERGSSTGEVEVERVHRRNRASGTWETAVERRLSIAEVLDDPKKIVNGHAVQHHVKLVGSCQVGDLARVSRGIATGANTFFVLDAETRRELDPAGRFTVPVIWKAEDVGEGLAFDSVQLSHLETEGRRCWLLNLDGSEKDVSPALRSYLVKGEREGIQDRYLCKARKPWFAMEPQAPPLAFVGVFGRQGMRVALNAVGARTLACCHRIYHHAKPRIDENALLLLVCFLRSELGREALAGQFRRYGGGLMKLEPRDLERVLVPDVRRLSRATLAVAATKVRARIVAGEPLADICKDASALLVREVAAHAISNPARRGQLQLVGLGL